MEQQPPGSPLFAEQQEVRRGAETESAPAPAKPRRRNRWIWIVLLTIFAVSFFLILKHKPGAAEQPHGRSRSGGPVTMNTATAHPGQMAQKLTAIGTVTSVYTTSITAQVTGRIIAVHYTEGQTVRKGSPLIDIDPRPYQAALDTAKGILERDQGLLAQAEMDLTRFQAAWARNAIARQQLDDQEKLVDQDKGLVRSDQGTVEADQVNVDYCHITSPITGRVGLRLVDPGNVVQANGTSALVVVAQFQPITVVFTIPEDSLPRLQDAMRKNNGPLKVAVFDRSHTHLLGDGHLETTDNQIDPTTGTLKLRAVFDNAKGALFPNQFVNTELLVDVLQNELLIPSEAVQQNGTQAFVFRVANGTAKIVNVKVIASDKSNSAVQGLNANDVVATTSFEKLQDGSKVRIVKQKIAADTDEESNTP